jgi:pyruvate kinase
MRADSGPSGRDARADRVRDSGDRTCSGFRDFGRRHRVILKIETAAAFAKLPAILLAAMARYPLGVMIARGHLAVEAGFERLAELQEEILWLCEAAHIPAIWATQVLDQMARTGTATRAEVTDAAMSVRAECVMLNKGPYVTEAVKTLIDILERMEDHQYKKRSLYRRLNLEVPTFIRQ